MVTGLIIGMGLAAFLTVTVSLIMTYYVDENIKDMKDINKTDIY